MSLLGTSWEDPRTAAIMGLAGGLLQGNAGAGLQQGLLGYQRQSQISNQTQRQQRYDAREDEAYAKQQKLEAEHEAIRARLREQFAKMDPRFAGMNGPTPAAAGAMGKVDPEQMVAYELAQADPIKYGGAFASSLKPKEPKYQVVGNSLLTIGPKGVNEVYRQPKETDWNQLMVPGPDGKPVLNTALFDAKRQLAAASASRNNTTVINAGQKGFDNEQSLRKEFQGLPTYKAFTEVQTAFDQIRTTLDNPSGANDLAAATKFMKLLDPGSVVRESELGMAMQTSGVFDKFSNYANMLATGQKLTPVQRKQFREAAEGLYKAAQSRYIDTAKDYRGQAEKWGLDADAVAPGAYKVYGYKSKQAAIDDARNAIMKAPTAKAEVLRRLEQELGITDHGLAR